MQESANMHAPNVGSIISEELLRSLNTLQKVWKKHIQKWWINRLLEIQLFYLVFFSNLREQRPNNSLYNKILFQQYKS